MKEEKNGGKFFNGLLWGAALGGGAAYMLSTKRGRDLIKELMQDGVDMLEKDLAPQKKAVEEILSPVMEEEVVVSITPKPAELTEKEIADKKRLFKKPSKK